MNARKALSGRDELQTGGERRREERRQKKK